MCKSTRAGKAFRVACAIVACLSILVGVVQAQSQQSQIPEINTILMKSTYLIYGAKKGDSTKISFGTAFLMGKPTPDNKRQYYVLITASHVLENIDGDLGTLKLREKQSDGSYTAKLWNINLRDKGVPLYVKHKSADVAALHVNMPDDLNVNILPTNLLADDDMLKKFEIHPGDELLCLGFPLLVSSMAGFPILRSGKIASYPIIPTALNNSFYYDFRVFDGNSGGPVYFVGHDRTYGGSVHLGETEQFVVGLVTSRLSSIAYENEKIQLAQVVSSTYIREAIDLLPETSPYK
jgi:hypothetical protein